MLFWTSSINVKLSKQRASLLKLKLSIYYYFLWKMSWTTDVFLQGSSIKWLVLQNCFVKGKKNCCLLTFLSLAWWLLIHGPIKTLCFMPPIYFQNSVSMPLCFAVHSSGLAISRLQPLKFTLLKKCLAKCQRSRVRSKQNWQDHLTPILRYYSSNNTRMT